MIKTLKLLKKALKELVKQCTRMCMELDLIDGNVLFVDGTKIRANASHDKNYTKQHGEKQLAEISIGVNVLTLHG